MSKRKFESASDGQSTYYRTIEDDMGLIICADSKTKTYKIYAPYNSFMPVNFISLGQAIRTLPPWTRREVLERVNKILKLAGIDPSKKTKFIPHYIAWLKQCTNGKCRLYIKETPQTGEFAKWTELCTNALDWKCKNAVVEKLKEVWRLAPETLQLYGYSENPKLIPEEMDTEGLEPSIVNYSAMVSGDSSREKMIFIRYRDLFSKLNINPLVKEGTPIADLVSSMLQLSEQRALSTIARDVPAGKNINALNILSPVSAKEFIASSKKDKKVLELRCDMNGVQSSLTMLPLVCDGTYDYSIDWGDGHVEHRVRYSPEKFLKSMTLAELNTYEYKCVANLDVSNPNRYQRFILSPGVSHRYAKPDLYTIKIWGHVEGWCCPVFPDSGSRANRPGNLQDSLRMVKWGCLRLGSRNQGRYFADCKYLVYVSKPNFDKVTDARYMFLNCQNFGLPQFDNFANWDVSTLTNMSGMFANCRFFNGSVSNWKVDQVTDFSYMFYIDYNFQQNLSKWVISDQVESTFRMFYGATKFVNRQSCEEMKLDEYKPNLKIRIMLAKMNTRYPAIRNDVVNNYGPISDWDVVPEVTNMCSLFQGYGDTELPNIARWNVSKVTNMRSMFDGASKFDQNISRWIVDNVTDMSFMFRSTEFNQDISSWKVSKVKSMAGMFIETPFNQNIGRWDVSNVTDMSDMFHNAKWFNQDLNSWKVHNVQNMAGMFSFALRFNNNIGSWDVSSVSNMSRMFKGTDECDFNQYIGSWNVSNVTDMTSMFDGNELFNQDIGSWNTSNAISMKNMFRYADDFNQNIGSWNVSNVADMSSMFKYARKFNQNLNSWIVSGVKTMKSMFKGATKFNGKIDNWDVSNVNDMQSMFERTPFNQDISSWDVSRVECMKFMFCNAVNFNQDISAWNVSNVKNMVGMFKGATKFKQNLMTWDVSNVEHLISIFDDAPWFLKRDLYDHWNFHPKALPNLLFLGDQQLDRPEISDSSDEEY